MKKISLFFVILIAFTACKKKNEAAPPASSPVDFTATSYQTLGSYDNTGKPSYLVPRDIISSNLLAYLNATLPERTDLRKSNPELLTTKAIADITVTTATDISITFVSQNTEFRNAVAFYTYPTNSPPASAKDIKIITYVFPNAGNNTPLQAGDKVDLGRFNAGTSVGFVLLKNAWDFTGQALNNTAVHFCSNDVLNPEYDPGLKKHAVLNNYTAEQKVLIGFEDIDRTQPACDHDFNDVVVYATVKPVGG